MLQAGRSPVRFSMRSLDILLSWPNPSSRTMALRSTQPLREMSTGNLPGGKGQSECKADNLTAMSADYLENVEASTSHNPMGLHGLLRDSFTFRTFYVRKEVYFWQFIHCHTKLQNKRLYTAADVNEKGSPRKRLSYFHTHPRITKGNRVATNQDNCSSRQIWILRGESICLTVKTCLQPFEAPKFISYLKTHILPRRKYIADSLQRCKG
jgi:hypothetical protein